MWHLHVLGGLRLCSDTRQLDDGTSEYVRFRTRKIAALLAYLALHPGPQPRESLVAALWPAANIKDGRNNLRVSLCALKQHLETANPGEQIVFADRQSVWLQENTLICDSTHFQSHWKASLGTTGVTRADHLQAAFDLYQGRLLQGYHDEWIEPLAVYLESLFERIGCELVLWYHQQGDVDRALAIASDAAQRVPEHSDFEALVRQLTQESLRPRPPVAPVSRRAVRERSPLMQAKLEPVQTNFEPEARGEVAPGLPLYPTRFWGRRTELSTLIKTVGAAEPMRLVTLVGPPAIGKTRLSVEAARQAIYDRTISRIYFVPLAGVESTELLADAVRSGLDLPASSAVSALDQVVAALRLECAAVKPQAASPQGRVMLLLDNLEHLLPEAAFWVQALRAQVPDLLIWTTSRAPLRLPGEELVDVMGLPVPQEADDMGTISATPSVQLFVQRARGVKPAFAVTPNNVQALAQLCQRLDGWPLALELAAARSHSFTPAQMVEQLQKGIDFLAHKSTGAKNSDELARQSSLHSAIQWSFQLLSPGATRFLLALAVFRGGATAEACAQVAGRRGALSHLAELVAHSLVTCDEKGGVLRYDLLEGVRQFAYHKLSEEQKTSLQARHAQAFATWLQEAAAWTGQGAPAWLEQLDIERDNLRAALEWSGEHDPVLLLQISSALWRYWESRGLTGEGISWLRKALEATDNAWETQDAAKIVAWNGMARLCFMATTFEAGLEAAQNAMNLACQRHDDSGLAYALLVRGIIGLYQGKVKASLQALEQSHSLFEKHGDLSGASHALIYLGFSGIFGGAYDQSLQTYERAIAKAREAGDDIRLAMALFFYGDALGPVGGRYDEALPYFQESYNASRRIGDLVAAAYANWGMCHVAIARSQLDTAQSYFEKLDDFCRHAQYRWIQVFVVEAAALLAAARGQWERATLLMGSTEANREHFGCPTTASYFCELDRQLSPIRQHLSPSRREELWSRGRRYTLEQALEAARGLEIALEALGADQGTTPIQETAPIASYPLSPQRAKPTLAESHLGCGRLALHQKDVNAAQYHLKQAYELSQELGDVQGAHVAQQWLHQAVETPKR